MNFRIEVTSRFVKQIKLLSKKYPSIKQDPDKFFQSLHQNPEQATPLGQNCYKLRLPVASKNKGKSGGGRVITHIQFIQGKIDMLSIYDKSEQGSLLKGL